MHVIEFLTTAPGTTSPDLARPRWTLCSFVLRRTARLVQLSCARLLEVPRCPPSPRAFCSRHDIGVRHQEPQPQSEKTRPERGLSHESVASRVSLHPAVPAISKPKRKSSWEWRSSATRHGCRQNPVSSDQQQEIYLKRDTAVSKTHRPPLNSRSLFSETRVCEPKPSVLRSPSLRLGHGSVGIFDLSLVLPILHACASDSFSRV